MAGGWEETVRSDCSGLVVLGEVKAGWRAPRGRGHGDAPTAAGTAAAAQAALLVVHPPFGQQLLLSVAVGQSSDAGVRLPLRGPSLCLDAAGRHTVALHQPGVALVLGGDAGLGAGPQLVGHGALRLRPSLRVVVLTLVAISALFS